MDNNLLQQFKDTLAQNDRVGIIVGKSLTVDDMAAALALYLSLKATNKPVTIASATQPIVELSSLVAVNEVRSTLGGAAGDLVVSFPYQEGEIEKVSYTIEGGYLNIVVKAGEQGLTFQEQDVRFTRGSAGLPSLLIVVGTPQLALLGDLFNPETLKDTTIVNIDTKADNQGYGDLVLVNPQYSSVSELMANLLIAAGLPMDVDTAQNLMNGIAFATNNFQSPQTSFYAFEMVAELMRRGAVRLPAAMPQAQPRPGMQPNYMQQPPIPQGGMPRSQQMSRPQGMPRAQFGQQQRGQQQSQNQPRMGQRMNQGQGQQQPQQQRGQQQQSQQNRQEEIRRALAEQARQARESQRMNQLNQGNQNAQPMQQPQQQPPQQSQNQPVQQPQNQPMPQSQPQPQPQPQNNQPMQAQPQDAETPQDAPSDWLTPKVYKGSTNIS